MCVGRLIRLVNCLENRKSSTSLDTFFIRSTPVHDKTSHSLLTANHVEYIPAQSVWRIGPRFSPARPVLVLLWVGVGGTGFTAGERAWPCSRQGCCSAAVSAPRCRRTCACTGESYSCFAMLWCDCMAYRRTFVIRSVVMRLHDLYR